MQLKNIESPRLYLSCINHELLADLETPVSAFYKVCKDNAYSFLLESVEPNERLGRYSIIGTEPVLVFTNKDNKTYLENRSNNTKFYLEENPFTALHSLLNEIEISENSNNKFIGFVGYVGYENIRWIEPKTKFKPFEGLPDVSLILPGKLVIFDHILHKVNLISIVIANSKEELKNKEHEAKLKLNSLVEDFNNPKTLMSLYLNYSKKVDVPYTSNFSMDEYIKMVKKAKEYIKKGDIFQVVPSQKLKIDGNYNGFLLYRALRSINPSPYLFYLNFGHFEIAGSSPEVMVKCDSNKVACLRPIAGTYPRGKDEKEDLKNISKLSNDPKERAEHLMLVDLARNDLGRVCEAGSINVRELMVIEKYSHVLHMVSLVEGVLKKDKTSIDLLCASFPAGTLSGAPKVRALEIINELEKNQRGPYGGCTGFIGLNNTINTCMTIRTFVVYKDHLEIQAGGGIVADSDPENEYKETLRKGAALLKALSMINPKPLS